MGRKTKTGREVLDGIVSMLFALADLAEDAAGRSAPVRSFVLWILCHADAVARDFVAGSAWNPAGRLWSPALPPIRYGSDPADAMTLAVSLRALALIVCSMSAQMRCLARLAEAVASALVSVRGGAHGENFAGITDMACFPSKRRDSS